jgi:SAM-dependent methyltransferase
LLREAIGVVHDFYGDYLAQLPPEEGLLEWERLIAGELQAPKTVIFVISKPSVLPMYRKALERYCREMGRSPVYLISDQVGAFDFRLSNLVIMKGDHTNIPLRNDFADFVVALDPPKPKLTQKAVEEFHRVTKEGGLSVLGFPNLEEHKDPLSIGAFVERIEYGLADDKQLDAEAIESIFKRHFQKVRTAKILDFTFFIGSKAINPRSNREHVFPS